MKLPAYLITAFFLLPSFVQSAEIDDARDVATIILQKFERKQNRALWKEHVSNWMKNKMTEEAFLAEMSTVQAQLGGTSSDRKIVRQTSAPIPGSGYSGTVYAFTFSASFPSAKAYEMVFLIREDGEYRISGIRYSPNTN